MQTTSEQERIIDEWYRQNPALCDDPWNRNLLAEFCAKHFSVAGMSITITPSLLDMAYRALVSKLHFLAGGDITNQLAAAAAVQTQLDAKNAEEERERKRIENENLREARQRNRIPGPASAYEGAEDRTSEEARARKAVRDQALKNALYAEFQKELRAANQILITMTDGSGRIQWGRTQDARAGAKEAIRRKYAQHPEFLREIS